MEPCLAVGIKAGIFTLPEKELFLMVYDISVVIDLGDPRKDDNMYTKNQICEKIRSIYPDIGECGIDIKTTYDRDNNAWVVNLKKDNHQLKTYLEPEDANICMEGKQCLGLGIQVFQLKDNIKLKYS